MQGSSRTKDLTICTLRGYPSSDSGIACDNAEPKTYPHLSLSLYTKKRRSLKKSMRRMHLLISVQGSVDVRCKMVVQPYQQEDLRQRDCIRKLWTVKEEKRFLIWRPTRKHYSD